MKKGKIFRSIKINVISNTSEIDDKNSIIIGTHNGVFHADEILAITCYINYLIDSEFISQNNIKVIYILRSRNPKELENADVLIDVGGDFDPDKLRFDHHQKEYEGDLSSFGMVCRNIGLDLLWYNYKEIDDIDNGKIKLDDIKNKDVKNIVEYIRESNPIDIAKSNEVFLDLIIKFLNMDFDFKISDEELKELKDKNEKIKNEYKDKIEKHVLENVDEIKDGVLEIPEDIFNPIWKDVIYRNKYPNIKWIKFWDKIQNCWTLQTVPFKMGDVKVPEDSNLNNVLDRDKCIFIHKNGFICKFKGDEIPFR